MRGKRAAGCWVALDARCCSACWGADANPARQQLQTDYAAKLAAHRDAVLLNPKLFARVEALYTQRDKAAPNAEAKRLIERYHRDMVRAGAQLSDEQKTRMKAINGELATLSARFNKAVLAEVNDSAIVVDTAEELARPERCADCRRSRWTPRSEAWKAST